MIPNKICVSLLWLQKLSSQGIVAFFAIFLAFLAYRKTMRSKHELAKSLLNAFEDELLAQKNWIGNEYPAHIEMRGYYNPNTIFNLSFESSKEVIKNDFGDIGHLLDTFRQKIVLFNERVDVFNAVLQQKNNLVASHPTYAYQLRKLLASNQKIDELNKAISNIDKENHEYFCFIEEVYEINRVIHAGLIGDGSANKEYSLYGLSSTLIKKINELLSNYDKKMPWYLRDNWLLPIFLLSAILFVLIENIW